jgi:hypothetical protein
VVANQALCCVDVKPAFFLHPQRWANVSFRRRNRRQLNVSAARETSIFDDPCRPMPIEKNFLSRITEIDSMRYLRPRGSRMFDFILLKI